MRIRLVDVEGTPEELAQLPELREALLGVPDLEPGIADHDDDEEGVPVPDLDAGELSKELRDFIAIRAGNRGRGDTVQAWVSEVLGWGTTTSELGRSRTSSDGLNNYLRLYAKGPRHFGAFAYVMPGNAKVMLRLLAKDADGYQHATIRKVKKGTGYEVTVLLDSDEAFQEALGLAKQALSRVQ